MNMLVVTMTVDPSRAAEVDRHLRDDVRAWAMRQPGFVSGHWLRLPEGERGFGLVVFETEEQASAAAAGPRSQARQEGRAWNTESVEVFEIVAQG